MRQTTLIGLAVVTAAALGAAIALPPAGSDAGLPAQPPSPTLLLPDLGSWSTAIDTVKITGATGTTTLDRTASGLWTIAEKGGYPATQPVAPLIDGLAHLKAVAPKTALPDLYGRLDVGGPGSGDAQSSLVTLSGAGHHLALILGKQHANALSGAEDGIYVRRPDAAQSWLATPALQVSSDPLTWIDQTIYLLAPAEIRSIALTGAGGTLMLTRDKPAETLRIADLPAGAKPKSADPGSDVLTAAQALDLADAMPAATLKAVSDGSVQIQGFDGLSLDLTLMTASGGTWIMVASNGGMDGAAIAKRTAGWAYRLRDDAAKTLRTRLADLLDAGSAKPAPAASPN
jgi:hypothetical protein